MTYLPGPIRTGREMTWLGYVAIALCIEAMVFSLPPLGAPADWVSWVFFSAACGSMMVLWHWLPWHAIRAVRLELLDVIP